MPTEWLRVTTEAKLLAGAIVLQGTALDVWFNILTYALAQKQTQQLMDFVSEDNPSATDCFKAYVAELALGGKPTPELPGSSTDDRVNTTRDGLNAVNRQPYNIQAELATGNGIENATMLIDTLATYKNLHDALQTFQYGIGSFQTVLNAADMMDSDPRQVRVLRDFLRQLRLVCQQVSETVALLPEGPTLRDIEQAWVDRLSDAARTLQVALDTLSLAAYDALDDVRSVLRSIPSRLDQQIFVTAKNLPFALLASGLDTIAHKLPANDPAVAPIGAAHDAILVLASTINARVIEHQKWQEVDRGLANLNEMVELDDAAQSQRPNAALQFSRRWRNLANKVQVLSDLDPNSGWTRALVTYGTGVNDQLTREIIDIPFILAFEAYRDEVQQRFVQVDLALKKECASLVRVSEPLHKILGGLQP